MIDNSSASERNLRNLNNYGKNQEGSSQGGRRRLTLTQDLKDFLYEDPKPPENTSPYKHLTGVLNDPMSPYKTPYTAKRFKNLADIINNKQYPGIYNQSAAPIADYYLQNNLDPFYYVQEWDDEARGNITIKLMIFLTARDQPWDLERGQDIDEVLLISRAYRDQLAAFKDQTDDVYILNSIRMTEKFVAHMTRKSQVYHQKTRARHPIAQPSIDDILKRLIG